jgi:hypothetical protein
MTFDELRFIGCFCEPNDWLAGIARVANARRKTISEWRKRGIPDNQAKAIRFRYQKEQLTIAAGDDPNRNRLAFNDQDGAVVGVRVYVRAAE